MRKIQFTVLTAVLLMSFAGVHAQASELGLSGQRQAGPMSHASFNGKPDRQSHPVPALDQNESTPPITDPNQASRINVSGTMNAHNTGIESLSVLARAAADAGKICDKAHWNSETRMCTNAYWTTKYADRPVTNLNGCKMLHEHVNASCYGLGEAGARGPTKLGAKYNSKLQTAAYPFKTDSKGNNTDGILGSVLVVIYQGTAHAVTVTDWGPAKKLQTGTKANRGIDLSVGSTESFGVRCSKFSGTLTDVTVYKCPMFDEKGS